MKRTLYMFILTIVLSNCSEKKNQNEIINKDNLLQTENELLQKIEDKAKPEQIATFLTFQDGKAETAMNYYVSLFKNSKIIDIERFGKEGPAPENSIMMATFELNGSLFACSDSYIKHEWSFTPGVSNFVYCTTEEEIQNLFDKLSENGNVFMPLDNYGWSSKFAFVEDQFGVSWQLNLK